MGTITRKLGLTGAFAGLLMAAACTPLYRDHGYVPIDADLASIQVGKSTREDVAAAIGPPGSTGLLEGSDWYYVGSRWKTVTWHAPEEISREVVAIRFDKSGRVSNVERFGLEKGEVVPLSRRVTQSNVKGIGLIRQLLGSIGRLNASQLLDR